MITKDTLREYQALELERKNLSERVKRLEQSPEEEQEAIEELKQIYKRKISEIVKIHIEIEKAIESLDSTERELVRLRYIDGKEWHQIANIINYSWQQTHRIHARALEKLAKLDTSENS